LFRSETPRSQEVNLLLANGDISTAINYMEQVMPNVLKADEELVLLLRTQEMVELLRKAVEIMVGCKLL
jgi:hypothetical protein